MNYRDPAFLRKHVDNIVSFYHPTCIDQDLGGYINQLLDDGTVFDRMTKHLVGTCRFIYNYGIAALLLDREDYLDAAAHGVRFLTEVHRQADGGFAWVLQGRDVEDGTRHCYGHAFVLLAGAAATKAGLDEGRSLVAETFDLLESRFWDSGSELYVDEIAAGDWSAVDPYRGQNANMHACEAMLAAFEATGDDRYADRALQLATRICHDLAAETDGLVWEHYHTDWTHDWDYNKDDPQNMFRPYGYLPGHFVEWAKLLLILERYRPEPWMLPSARHLFDTAVEKSWDHERGGMHYSFGPDGQILDRDRYYWVLSETFAAAAALALKTRKDGYWEWYDRVWAYCDEYFVDHEHGGWYRILSERNEKVSAEKSPASKTDYHPLAACYETLVVTGI